ncbi:HAD family hydrolase [Neotamlana laminarinivorans]|uniref:HAD family phosphatase n=1 Tax=Neotamlana laminarinivorans TaxID=2883124 RepID=A0A9X1L0J1_9FLAO|nr:HAD family phosphatase [Tamlana laminarinivorans]MCB4797610.1 HAD family phosphatase [Tamlana laminarinivorans]
MKDINAIIFDLGGVLVNWSPEHLFTDVFNGDAEKAKWFIQNICTLDWNEEQDAGRTIEEANKVLTEKYPEYKTEILQYYGRWEEMLLGPIEGTVKILDYFVKNTNYKVVALTNWSSELFPIALQRFEFLKWFEGIVVSGDENTRKPFDEIYNLTLERYNITAENAIFIDDNLRNIEAANKLGINGIRFESPELLIEQLKDYNININ